MNSKKSNQTNGASNGSVKYRSGGDKSLPTKVAGGGPVQNFNDAARIGQGQQDLMTTMTNTMSIGAQYGQALSGPGEQRSNMGNTLSTVSNSNGQNAKITELEYFIESDSKAHRKELEALLDSHRKALEQGRRRIVEAQIRALLQEDAKMKGMSLQQYTRREDCMEMQIRYRHHHHHYHFHHHERGQESVRGQGRNSNSPVKEQYPRKHFLVESLHNDPRKKIPKKGYFKVVRNRKFLTEEWKRPKQKSQNANNNQNNNTSNIADKRTESGKNDNNKSQDHQSDNHHAPYLTVEALNRLQLKRQRMAEEKKLKLKIDALGLDLDRYDDLFEGSDESDCELDVDTNGLDLDNEPDRTIESVHEHIHLHEHHSMSNSGDQPSSSTRNSKRNR